MDPSTKLKINIRHSIFLFVILLGCSDKENTSSEVEMKVISDVLKHILETNDLLYNGFEFFEIKYYLNHSDSISKDSLRVLFNTEKDKNKEKTILLPDLLVPMKKEYFDIYSKNFSYVYREIYGKEPTDSIIELKSNKSFDINKVTTVEGYKFLRESKNRELIKEEGVSSIRFSRVYFYENYQKALLVYEYFCQDGSGMCYAEDLYFVSLNSEGKWVIDKIHNLIVV